MASGNKHIRWAAPAIASAILILVPAGTGQAAPGTTSADKKLHPFPPAIERSYIRALADMGRSNYQEASSGQQRAQKAFIKEMQTLVRFTGPEQRARVIKMLQFQRGLLRWARELIFLPVPEAAGQADYWLHGKKADLIAALLSRGPHQRIAAAGRIAKMKGWQSDDMIGFYVLPMLADGNSGLVKAAVDALKHRTPTRDLVAAICRRLNNWQSPAPRVWAGVEGRHYLANVFPTGNWRQATELSLRILAQWHLGKYRTLINHRLATRPGHVWAGLQDTRSAGTVEDLLLKLKPPELARQLIHLIHSTTTVTNVIPQVGYFDGHTAALYVLIKLAGKDPTAFHFQKITWYSRNGLWTEFSRHDQLAAIRAITAWYATHGIAKRHPAWWDAPAGLPTESAIRAMATRSQKMLMDGLRGLDSDNFRTRRGASQLLNGAIALQVRTILMIAAKTNFQHAFYLLQNEEGFTAWMLWAIHGLPAEQTRRLAWGFTRGNRQLATGAFCHDYLEVVGAMKLFLKRRQDPQAMDILNWLLHSKSELLFLHAADTVMRIGPTDTMANALYRSCVPGDNLSSVSTVKLLGEWYQIAPEPGPLEKYIALDSRILVRWKPPAVARLIAATANRWMTSSVKAKQCNIPVAWNQKWTAFAGIFICYRPPSAVRAFVRILHFGGVPNGIFGGLTMDNRQPLVYILARASGKSPAAMGMVKNASTGNAFPWAFRSLHQEQVVITQICAWWKAHPNGPAAAGGH